MSETDLDQSVSSRKAAGQLTSDNKSTDLAKRIEMAVPDIDQAFIELERVVEALRRVQRIWYKRGRDKGLNFDLEVSIALAQTSLTRAHDADRRGAAQNDFGTALATLGELDNNTDRLEAAVIAYRAALEERTRKRVPLDWAMTQGNLAHQTLFTCTDLSSTSAPRSTGTGIDLPTLTVR